MKLANCIYIAKNHSHFGVWLRFLIGDANTQRKKAKSARATGKQQ